MSGARGSIVEKCVKQCLAFDSPLAAFAWVLEEIALDFRLTPLEFKEIQSRAMRRIVDEECSGA